MDYIEKGSFFTTLFFKLMPSTDNCDFTGTVTPISVAQFRPMQVALVHRHIHYSP